MPSKSQSERSASPARVALGIHQSTRTGMMSVSFLNTRLRNPGVMHEAATSAFRATTGQAQRSGAGDGSVPDAPGRDRGQRQQDAKRPPGRDGRPHPVRVAAEGPGVRTMTSAVTCAATAISRRPGGCGCASGSRGMRRRAGAQPGVELRESCGRTFSQEYSRRTHSRPIEPRRRSESRPSDVADRRAAPNSPHGTHQPAPLLLSPDQGVVSVTTAGTPFARASAIESPKFSLWDGSRNREAIRVGRGVPAPS